MRNARYFLGIMMWAVLMEMMMGDNVDFEHPDSDGSFDFQGKNRQ